VPVEMVTDNSCCVPRFPLIVSCYKIVYSQTSFFFAKESEILERSGSDILPPTPQPWSEQVGVRQQSHVHMVTSIARAEN